MGGKPAKQPPLAARTSIPAIYEPTGTSEDIKEAPEDTAITSADKRVPQEDIAESVSPSPSDVSDISDEESTSESGNGNVTSCRFTVEEFRAAPRMGATRSAPQLLNRNADTNHTELSILLTPDCNHLKPKIYGHGHIPQFNDRELEGMRLPDQQWSDACRDSLRKALFVHTQTDIACPDTRSGGSAPTSLEKLEVMRSPLPKNEVARCENRRSSILSSLNVKLDVIPERAEDEKENPDDYEYSEINLYF